MELKLALEGQFRAGLEQVRQCIERCPDDLWSEGKHPRTFWRIAYHTLYFTHLYFMPLREDFIGFERHQDQAYCLWDDDSEGLPPVETTYSREEMLGYLQHILDGMHGWLAAIDLESEDSGFYWYRIPKLDHILVNLRHLGIHTGQMQELLYSRGIDLDWIGRK